MSNFTTEVRYICESAAGINTTGIVGSLDYYLDAGYSYIFDFDFPLFNPDYREELCKKILKHFYTREICCETVGLWKLLLNARMNDIMPYYNQLYKSAELEFDPLHETDIMRTGAYTDDGKTNSQSNGKQLYQNTPQGNVAILDDEHYLTDVTKNINSSNSNNNMHRDYWENVKGRTGQNASKLLADYRKTFLNIDMMIIKDLEDLFFGLWE